MLYPVYPLADKLPYCLIDELQDWSYWPRLQSVGWKNRPISRGLSANDMVGLDGRRGYRAVVTYILNLLDAQDAKEPA